MTFITVTNFKQVNVIPSALIRARPGNTDPKLHSAVAGQHGHLEPSNDSSSEIQ